MIKIQIFVFKLIVYRLSKDEEEQHQLKLNALFCRLISDTFVPHQYKNYTDLSIAWVRRAIPESWSAFFLASGQKKLKAIKLKNSKTQGKKLKLKPENQFSGMNGPKNINELTQKPSKLMILLNFTTKF